MVAQVLVEGNPPLARGDLHLPRDCCEQVSAQRLIDLRQHADIRDRCLEVSLRQRAVTAQLRRCLRAPLGPTPADLAGAVQLAIRTGECIWVMPRSAQKTATRRLMKARPSSDSTGYSTTASSKATHSRTWLSSQSRAL